MHMNANSKTHTPPVRRYLAIWFNHLSTDRIERAHSPRRSDPRIVVHEVKGALRLHAMNAGAQRLVLRRTMPLADVRAMYPAIAVDTADEAADARLLEAISDWLSRYTPLVGLSPPDGTMLDITGCAHLFGGEDAMRRDVVRRLHEQGLSARTAIAGTPGAAWALSRYGERRNITDAELKETLQPLPLAALQLDAAKVDALARVGLKRVADIMDRPRAPLAARFGAGLLQRLDRALGLDDEPITPRLPVAPYLSERNFLEPVMHEAFILQTIEHLAADLSRRMEERGEGARTLQVTLFRVDGAVRRLSVATSRPQRDPRALHRLFRERFSSLTDELDLGCGFDVIRLAVTTAEKAEIAQTDLVSATGIDRSTLADMITRMERRGWIIRVTATNDARANAVTLAASGRATFTACIPFAKAADEAVLEALPRGDRKALMDLLGVLSAAADKAATKAPRAAKKAPAKKAGGTPPKKPPRGAKKKKKGRR